MKKLQFFLQLIPSSYDLTTLGFICSENAVVTVENNPGWNYTIYSSYIQTIDAVGKIGAEHIFKVKRAFSYGKIS